MGATRGHCEWLDGVGACPSAVDSARSGNCVVASVFVADGPKIYVIYSFTFSLYYSI
jgi:hypothetical protein